MISDEDFRFLLDVSRGATKILEIGTGTGKSTAALALCGARLHTIDKDDIFVYNGLNARRYNCTSNEWWKSTDHANFDFLFIDGQLNDMIYILRWIYLSRNLSNGNIACVLCSIYWLVFLQ